MDRWPVDNYYTVNRRKLEYGIRMIGAGIPYNYTSKDMDNDVPRLLL